jgi:hypothetical protein
MWFMIIHLTCFNHICSVHMKDKRFENDINLAYILS